LTNFEALLDEVGERGHDVGRLPFAGSTAWSAHTEECCLEWLGLIVVGWEDD